MIVFFLNIFVMLRKPRTSAGRPVGGEHPRAGDVVAPPAHNFDSLPPIRSDRPVYDLRKATRRWQSHRGGAGGEPLRAR